MLYAIAMFTIVFIMMEGRSLIRNREWKELVITAGLLLIAISYGLDYTMEWNQIPNPTILFNKLKPVADAFDAYFLLQN
ncbi:MAG: hypothetical protein CVU90_06600 [Firmicutes bacterium HGW-Firmicutes-15]|nr:MAG: hypothetical protein CVU90_06600 [Firmicutes bacterium HGW-Firmicutes-15]